MYGDIARKGEFFVGMVNPMTLFRDVSQYWSLIHVAVVFLLLFRSKYPPRRTWVTVFAICAALLVLGVSLLTVFGWENVTRVALVTCSIPSAVLFYLLSEYRDGRFFFTFCISDTTCIWLMQLTNLLDRLCGGTYVVLLISRLVLFPLLEVFLWKKVRRPYLELQAKLSSGWWIKTAIAAGFYLLLMVVSIPVGIPITGYSQIITLLVAMALMPVTYVAILGSLRRQILYYEARNRQDLFATRDELAQENLRILQEGTAALSKARHDILGHLNTLQALTEQKEYGRMEEYLEQITQQARMIVPLKLTDHPVANAVLLQYAERAKQAGTRFECHAELPSSLPVPDSDLSSFLTNMLSNALKAAQGEGGWIEVTIHIRGKYLFLECQNSYSGTLERDELTGLYLSNEGAGHGWGMKIMEDIARRYQGELQAEGKDGVFLVRTALLMPEKQA